ncbi:isocitrate lyase/phosphoenolpyruvate mutase family protein [Chishuiella sp.]|uniref:isocitrate lyase/PEP mutase family protein n=1 Tax=Chishuiella sp. TaxID=1969467 RepID=UPI0028AD2D81|nr:isocitrate lyase/phosphoenolpyruvate mutase family protein [Chishuiella sp.]
MNFTELHQQNNPLLIANVWDIPSTKIAEELGFQAIGTSSAAIASLFGYNDGEDISFSELEYMVKRIRATTQLPLSVDIESGYSDDTDTIANNIIKLVNLGIVGINIEDSKVNEKRELINAEKFAQQLLEIKTILKAENKDVFINVRTDTFLLGVPNVIDETKKRIDLYTKVGANGIFVPCIENSEDIQEIVNYTRLPINVMCMPNLPDFEILKNLGVKRISMGNFLFDKMYQNFKELENDVLINKSFKSIF